MVSAFKILAVAALW